MRQSSFTPDHAALSSLSPRISGTKEWSTVSANCILGCSHRCRYCYARARSVDRFHQLTAEQWENPRLREKEVVRRWPKIEGTIMFPSTHDILPEFIEPVTAYLLRILASGNRVLIVSKPHLSCIRHLCGALAGHKPQVLFRFTVGADDDSILKFWEPGAPAFAERLASLQYAKGSGYATSVSVEPMLDFAHIRRLVVKLAPFVTDSIWIGKMNRIADRVHFTSPEERAEVSRIRAGQTDPEIRGIYSDLKEHPLIRWKESIKEVIGLALASAPGQDI